MIAFILILPILLFIPLLCFVHYKSKHRDRNIKKVRESSNPSFPKWILIIALIFATIVIIVQTIIIFNISKRTNIEVVRLNYSQEFQFGALGHVNPDSVGGLLWSPELLSGGSGILNPDNGICYYTQDDAIKEADKQGLRLPTENEFRQFYAKTTFERTERNGRPGMLFIDKENGNSIFFPVSSYRKADGSFTHVGTYGFYWSASDSSAFYGYGLCFDGVYVYPNSFNTRTNGFPVRCVLN